MSALRFQAVMIAGLLCGIAGAYLSTAHGAGFIREMTAGKGYIALAALILAIGGLFRRCWRALCSALWMRWRPDYRG